MSLEVPEVVQMADLVESLHTLGELICHELAFSLQCKYVQAVTCKTPFDTVHRADTSQDFRDWILSLVACQLQVPQYSLVLTLLEVTQYQQICRYAPQQVLILHLLKQPFAHSQLDYLLFEAQRLQTWND